MKRIQRLLLSIVLLSGTNASPATSQAARPATPEMALALPLLIQYNYFARAFTETLGGNGPYSEIEAFIEDDAASKDAVLSRVELKERATGKKLIFADAKVAREWNATPAAIQFKKPAALAPGSIASLEFAGANAQPVRWRFVFAFPVSPQGSGLTPLPDAPGILLNYRDQGSLAGEGSAVQIGGVVSEAEVWKEIAYPPAFVPYRGTYTEGAHMAAIPLVNGDFRLDSPPAAFADGGRFQLSDASGRQYLFALTASQGGLLLSETAPKGRPARDVTFVSAKDGSLQVDSMGVTHNGHRMSIAFHPALPLDAAGTPVAFRISVDKNHKLAEGTAQFTRDGAAGRIAWHLKSPDWAKNRAIEETISVSPAGLSVRSSQK